MKTKQGRAAVSSGILIAIIIVIIVIAASGSYFLLFNKGTSQTTTSTQSTISSTSSASTSSAITRTGSGVPTSTTTQNSSSNSSVNSQYNLPYNSSNHTVFIFLVTQTNTTSNENYNLTNFGAMKIYVPLNWDLNIRLFNNESLPHNILLVKNSTDVPTSNDVGTQGAVLFAVGASTTSYQYNGVPGGQGASAVYTSNNQSGTFWLTCGVHAHGGAGMFAVLVVSPTVTTPYVVVTNPVLTPSVV